MQRLLFLVPLIAFVIVGVNFAIGLNRDPAFIPSSLIDKPVPEFELAPIEGYARGFSSADLKGEISLVNVFGSWCASCRLEHPVLMGVKRQGGPPIYGLNWRDKPGDGTKWLEKFGDPYHLIGDDADGRVAIEFGVTGAPETFIVDPFGRIRHKHVGPITQEVWAETFLPIFKELENEGLDTARGLVSDNSGS